jgi:deoxyribonuclease-1-like protein
MKRYIITILFLIIVLLGYAKVAIISWNLYEFGGSKDEYELQVIAQTVRDFDLIIIQEVVAKDPKGAQTVAKLADQLNRMGSKWDYIISHPTESPSVYMSERYAILWKTARLKLRSNPRLISELSEIILREPYYAEFEHEGKYFHVLNYHSRRFDQNPEEELAAIIDMILSDPDLNWILAGDFNLDEHNELFEVIYNKGFKPAIENQPTTLKRECLNDRYLNHAIDNIYYNSRLNNHIDSGVVDFVGDCEGLLKARGISDHLPVYLKIE